MSIWLIAAIGGLLATQFVNPVLIYRFFEEIVICIKKKVRGRKSNFDIGIKEPGRFLWHQILFGGTVFVIIALYNIFFYPDRTGLQILSTICMSVITAKICKTLLMTSIKKHPGNKIFTKIQQDFSEREQILKFFRCHESAVRRIFK